MLRLFIISAISIILCGTRTAQADPPLIEAYGELPTISHMALSPNGKLLAYILRKDGKNVATVLDYEKGEFVYATGVDKINATRIAWASDKHLIIGAFDNTRIFGFRGKVKYTASFAINIETKKVVQLLRRSKDVYPGQSGLGKIVGLHENGEAVFMPAFTGDVGAENPYSILKVDLDSGKGRISNHGNTDTVDWFVDTDGTVLAQEIYNNRTNKYEIRTKASGKWKSVIKFETAIGPNGLTGITPDRSALIVLLRNDEGYNEIRYLNFDGTYSEPVMAKPETEIIGVLTDQNRIALGVIYGGLQPTYDFFDESLAEAVVSFQAKAKHASVRLSSWSADFSKLLFYVEGTNYAGEFYLMDRKTDQLLFITSARPSIPREAVNDVLTIKYKAQDGLTIPGVMTVPRGAEIKNLPAIIMPHGGPEDHDQIGFDWMAQYFASRGYLVFQPNFRGSDGFGTAFTEAGYGGWGGVMQQDITDGVQALKNGGMIDPERVCIVGWSYGGYAALAGGAFTPELYKCVGAIAPVSDLPRMLLDEKRDHGKYHWAVSYWEKAIANGDATRETLREKSPAMYADNFQAPVLLIHGKDDLVVPYRQSQRMKRALEKADKSVELIAMRGEDHGLSSPGVRLEALTALDAFIETHIGNETASQSTNGP